MAHFSDAKPFSEQWLDERIGIRTLRKVLAQEYWIPKILTFYGQWVWL